ncbi:RagB/SusD family nutrient uptake outer membrane protein [Mucilaginibacter sp. RS28]|uniref:RagB/SusD family nutrient uptake outer membrane protein n=1 Tax=Mucilaginibacter straminoryzae TaxID=2932774 RepID=A0A9X2BA09_9SPHI|nr:RagB/SusD family nutrient uptake outer membrane protein [Mucilaginibacter straminoryzae]MCJ8211259.1 RagB/SusD family nutrient uptake outer membrane protein [Mucilaginibacter straminoryzae]
MKKTILTILILAAVVTSCKKELNVENPNSPTVQSASTESGVISLAQGGVYQDGFRELKYGDGVFGLFWSGAMGFHSMMGDEVGAEAANAYINQIGCPDYVILDNGNKVVNPNAPAKQHDFLRAVNLNGNQGQNPTYYEWAYMYNLINACNNILDIANKTTFTGNAGAKKATLQAWAYWWKGFAYAHIGSIYYAGLIVNTPGATNGNYVTKEAIITESNANLDKAATTLSGITDAATYSAVLGKLIPDFCQVGHGGVLSTSQWVKNINTLKARNILVNTPVAKMTTAQWTSILSLTNAGIGQSDLVFTGRSNATSDFLDPTSGTVSAKTTAPSAGANTYKLSERWVQDFKAGDKRLANVALTKTWIGNSDRGNIFNTRYTLVDAGTAANFPSGVIQFSNRNVGGYELFLAGSYEENELMKAEAKLYLGDIPGALTSIDNVRDYEGSGLAHVSGTTNDITVAKEELRRERRIGLAFRGLSFYDARRWGVINDVSAGGGRTNAVVIDNSATLNTKATINYNFLDYWDVPDNELAYNPPASGSAPTKNPN